MFSSVCLTTFHLKTFHGNFYKCRATIDHLTFFNFYFPVINRTKIEDIRSSDGKKDTSDLNLTLLKIPFRKIRILIFVKIYVTRLVVSRKVLNYRAQ